MARRRFQRPTPQKRGKWWSLRLWEDTVVSGKVVRRRVRKNIAPITTKARELEKILDEVLAPLNRGLLHGSSAMLFQDYVKESYRLVELPLMAKSTQERSEGVIEKYLLPTFGKLSLRDMTTMTIQQFFSGMVKSELSYASKDKIRDVLSSILASAKKYGVLHANPAENIRLPREHRASRIKPYITPQQFTKMVLLIQEPYATMVYVAVYTGLRISELIGLRWNDVHEDTITIDERCCRGDWGVPKSEASNANISVPREVIGRIHGLKNLTLYIKAGRATRKYQAVKSREPEDLVFQSVMRGVAMRDNNILSRFIKPAAKLIQCEFVNWRVLRRSHATWLKMAGADVKDAQAQMRHSRASTTLDIYQQFVPESQRKAVNRLVSLHQTVN